MAKKKLGGEEAHVNEITSFEAWTEHVKKHIAFTRGDGRVDRFLIHALTSEQVEGITKGYNDLIPPKPKPVLSSKGNPDPRFPDRMKDYEDKINEANKWMQFKYILEGWVYPNEIEVPGKNEDEKIVNMKKSVAGDASKLFEEIIKLSNIGNEDVDFF